MKQAVTLWKLVDAVDAARASQIETIIDRAVQAAGDEEVRIKTGDLRELVRLIDGVEDAIITAGIVDEHWRVPAERLEELNSQEGASHGSKNRTVTQEQDECPRGSDDQRDLRTKLPN